MSTETKDDSGPVAGQVQQPVRPAAWVRDLGPQPHCVTDLRYCAAGDVERGEHLQYLPLYGQAALDAAVAAERERLAKWYAETGWLLDEDDVADAMRRA